MQATPIALSVNEMYSITKRLRLPFDAKGVGRAEEEREGGREGEREEGEGGREGGRRGREGGREGYCLSAQQHAARCVA